MLRHFGFLFCQRCLSSWLAAKTCLVQSCPAVLPLTMVIIRACRQIRLEPFPQFLGIKMKIMVYLSHKDPPPPPPPPKNRKERCRPGMISRTFPRSLCILGKSTTTGHVLLARTSVSVRHLWRTQSAFIGP